MAKKQTLEDSALVGAAKKIGAAVGKVAAARKQAPAAEPGAKPAKTSGKFPKQNKARLPRREKKAQKKAAAAKS
jgi:hypothetical protein